MSASPVINKMEDLIEFSPTKPSCAPDAKKEAEPHAHVQQWLNSLAESRKAKEADAARKIEETRASRDNSDNEESRTASKTGNKPNKSKQPATPTLAAMSSPAHSAVAGDKMRCTGTTSTLGNVQPRRRSDAFFTGSPGTSAGPGQSPSRGSDRNETPIRQTACTVIVHPLPAGIAIQDIFARISTGEVRNATIVDLPHSQLGAAKCAVITFKEPRAAGECVEIGTRFENVWSFKLPDDDDDDDDGAETSDGPKLIQSELTCAELVSPPFSFSPDDIALQPQPFGSQNDDDATRCLIIRGCALDKVYAVWSALGLSRLLKMPHYVKNVQDIWLDSFQRGGEGRTERADLHLHFSNVNMAMGLKFHARALSATRRMQFEQDPCNGRPYDVFFRPAHDPGFAWRSVPSQSLFSVHTGGHLVALFERWAVIARAVRASHKATDGPHKRTPEEGMRDRDERARVARENSGLDPVTLMRMHDPDDDDDSDDEGRPGPSRIDTRRMAAGPQARRCHAAQQPLLHRDAYVDALVALARVPPTPFSPGTQAPAPRPAWTQGAGQGESSGAHASSPVDQPGTTEERKSEDEKPASSKWDDTCDLETREALKYL